MHDVLVGIGAVALLTSAATIAAQAPPTKPGGVRLGVGVGTTVPSGYLVNFPDEMGLHAQLVASWRKSPRLTLRVDGLATMLAGASEDVLCAPSAPACRPTNVPHPDQVYAVNASAELRRSGANDRLYGLIGAGAYYARGPSSTSFGTAAGVVAGVGASLTRPTRAGLALELRYHYIPASFGTLNGMLTPSLVFRF